MTESMSLADRFTTRLITNPLLILGFKIPEFHYHFECVGSDGKVKWVEDAYDNAVNGLRRMWREWILYFLASLVILVMALGVGGLMGFFIFGTITTLGGNDVLDKYFKGSAYTAAWYLGLKGAGSVVAGDTLASHAGWSEVNPYTGNRPAITFGTTSGRSNTATTNAFSITVAGPTTVAGGFVCTVNTGTGGLLYSGGDFATSRSVVLNDTLNVTLTVTA